MASSYVRRNKMGLRKAVCDAAGWKYCAEHDAPRWNGSRPCAYLHRDPPIHAYYCGHGLDTEECICGALAQQRDVSHE